ncbi:MAG: URC4/urg3 family protein [Casimicrobium sp.]
MTDSIDYLLSSRAVRERAHNVLARVHAGDSKFWRLDESRIANAADVVANVTRERYPDLKIPYHSRWRHFEAGGRDRYAKFVEALGNVNAAERARSEIDLAVTSVLLDAGAGPDWKFVERGANQVFTRSEGLGVASFHAFMQGAFSSIEPKPFQADATGLQRFTANALADAFQVSATNPLIGVEGRAALIRTLGDVVSRKPQFESAKRIGGLFDFVTKKGMLHEIRADDVLRAVLDGMNDIWPSANVMNGKPLGDCWHCELVDGWMPFHKLSQWLAYSLLEPFQRAGVTVANLDALTGLPEYRNGGLFLDTNVIVPRDASLLSQSLAAGDQAIVEWRALTVALIDELAPLVRARLGLSAEQMPLASVLEGGTWAAGRKLAADKRNGLPPLNIVSDGTVF